MPLFLGCIPSGSRYGNVPNELVHRAGPPFLDNHYHGYQYKRACGLLRTDFYFDFVPCTIMDSNYFRFIMVSLATDTSILSSSSAEAANEARVPSGTA